MDPQSKPLGVVSSTSYYIHTQTILSRKSGTVFPYDESLIHLPVHVYCSHHPGYICVSSLSPGFPFYPAHIHPSNPTLCSSQTELLKKKKKTKLIFLLYRNPLMVFHPCLDEIQIPFEQWGSIESGPWISLQVPLTQYFMKKISKQAAEWTKLLYSDYPWAHLGFIIKTL